MSSRARPKKSKKIKKNEKKIEHCKLTSNISRKIYGINSLQNNVIRFHRVSSSKRWCTYKMKKKVWKKKSFSRKKKMETYRSKAQTSKRQVTNNRHWYHAPYSKWLLAPRIQGCRKMSTFSDRPIEKQNAVKIIFHTRTLISRKINYLFATLNCMQVWYLVVLSRISIFEKS